VCVCVRARARARLIACDLEIPTKRWHGTGLSCCAVELMSCSAVAPQKQSYHTEVSLSTRTSISQTLPQSWRKRPIASLSCLLICLSVRPHETNFRVILCRGDLLKSAENNSSSARIGQNSIGAYFV